MISSYPQIQSPRQPSIEEPTDRGGDSTHRAFKSFNCSVVPTSHCADTHEWRKKLIVHAKHHVVISGNFCGGKAFDEILKLIQQQLDKIPTFRAIVMGHPTSIKDSRSSILNPIQNRHHLSTLADRYPTRFYFIECPDVIEENKKSINHTKCLIADFGKYFILGGSGIKDNFNTTGLDDPCLNHPISPSVVPNNSFVARIKKMNSFKTGSYRDQDFVFRCSSEQSECGKKVYRQALALAYKWDRFKKDSPHRLQQESWELDDLPSIRYPALTDRPFSKPPKIHQKECVLYRMLKRRIPDANQLDMEVPDFIESTKKVLNVAIDLFFTGPETPYQNPFTSQLLRSIHAAKREILIDHMYFQPPKDLLEALVAAVKRGVVLTIVTAGVTQNCPNSEKNFGPKNESHYLNLLDSLDDFEKKHVIIYLFNQTKKGLHKKICIVDNCLFAGSSNMDAKCLKRMGDHEMNFAAVSEELVERTKDVIFVDIAHSKRLFYGSSG